MFAVWNPGSVCAAFSSDRRNRNAVTTSISDSATCAVTSELRSRNRLRSAVALRAVQHRREVGAERVPRRRQPEDQTR